MLYKNMFEFLEKISSKPLPYEHYTAMDLWNDPYISKKMLEAHLNPDFEPASRKKEFIDRSVKWMTERFGINNESKVCDFGCGPGLYTTPFALLGADVTGIDFSEHSIQYAQKIALEKGLSINYILKNYLDFFSDKNFDLITMIYCDFCALSDEQRKNLLSKFYKLLKKEGFVFFDVSSISHYNSAKEKSLFERSSDAGFWSNFWSEKPYYVFTHTFKYDNEKLLLDKYVILEKERTREIFNWIKCYSIHAITEELKQNGFKVIEFYSNVAGDKYENTASEITVIAKKAQLRNLCMMNCCSLIDDIAKLNSIKIILKHDPEQLGKTIIYDTIQETKW